MTRLTGLLLAVLFSAATFAAEPGERWQYSMQMKGDLPGGIQIPAMTMEMCQPPGWKEPPKAQGQSDCEVRNYQRSGDTYTWEMQCPQMKGKGRMTLQGDDRFNGHIEMVTEGRAMQMDMSGQKIGGACDPQASAMKINGQQLPSRMELEKLARDLEGQARMTEGQANATEKGASAPDCVAALAKEQLDVLLVGCPAERQVLAAKVCVAGAAEKYALFCQAAGAPPAKEKVDVKEGLKKLKDLIRW